MTSLTALAVLLAMAVSASAEVDAERFFPISIGCPAGSADELSLVSANAAGRYTRMAMKGNRLTLSVRHQGTDWKFRTNYDVAEDEIDRRLEERTRTLLRNSLQALRDFEKGHLRRHEGVLCPLPANAGGQPPDNRSQVANFGMMGMEGKPWESAARYKAACRGDDSSSCF
ncbi:hypothetical protein [Bradyrhizobium sp. Arg816]|uniref:hypothetical protein n=1 Tax=Bradyrhizobium sp. Arg816 TaxID=2998491 RepID=UPI00249F8AF0|nr:hypothetical protein [Bradyrhizobium sp. Arg816]MDI3561204.1 hypothetical protein [Bradyrhizobium sp. Arg816]